MLSRPDLIKTRLPAKAIKFMNFHVLETLIVGPFLSQGSDKIL
jgi:hypothetical protein